MQHRHEHIYVETDRHRISGVLTLPVDGYRSRLSDFLNASERDFISLTNCVVELIGRDGPGTEHPSSPSRAATSFAIPLGEADAASPPSATLKGVTLDSPPQRRPVGDQAALVGLTGAGIPAWLQRYATARWALVLLSIAVVVGGHRPAPDVADVLTWAR